MTEQQFGHDLYTTRVIHALGSREAGYLILFCVLFQNDTQGSPFSLLTAGAKAARAVFSALPLQYPYYYWDIHSPGK